MPDPDVQDFLRQFLVERDMPCPVCGYNLRNLQSLRCPECGEELKLAVGVVEPKQAAAIAGLIALASGLGLSGLLLIYAAIMSIHRGRQIVLFDEFFLINGAGLVLFAVLMAIWLWKWRRIRRASPGYRWLLTAGCWGLALTWIVFFSFTIR